MLIGEDYIKMYFKETGRRDEAEWIHLAHKRL
jgi:hypothetical protein